MNYIALLFSMFLIDLLAAITPGPNFFLVSQTALSKGRKNAIAATIGITLSNLIWAVAVVIGLTTLFNILPSLYIVLKILGSLYLIYLGFSLWIEKKNNSDFFQLPFKGKPVNNFGRGFLTGILNPKSLIYFGSIFAFFLKPGTPILVQVAAILIVCFNTLVWYGFVAIGFSASKVRAYNIKFKRIMDKVAGTVLIAFGIKLIVSNSK